MGPLHEANFELAADDYLAAINQGITTMHNLGLTKAY